MDQNFRLGDIIIFKAEDDYLSKCIAWLTDSDVSHAAMIYSEDAIVEVIADGVNIHNVEITKGDQAYLMRLKKELSPDPLIKSAEVYLNAKTRYDFPALLFLGGLLIYRKIRPTKKLLHITNRIIQIACLELDKLIQKFILKNPDGAVVCSQLIYQIYSDCGGDYQIKIKNGCLENDNFTYDSSESTNFVRLADLYVQDYELDTLDMSSENSKDVNENELIFQLHETLIESLNENINKDITDTDFVSENNSFDQIKPCVSKFISQLNSLLKLLDSDIPVDALFVTPGDLVYNAENLVNICTFGIERV